MDIRERVKGRKMSEWEERRARDEERERERPSYRIGNSRK
jgi:hypothetical protein